MINPELCTLSVKKLVACSLDFIFIQIQKLYRTHDYMDLIYRYIVSYIAQYVRLYPFHFIAIYQFSFFLNLINKSLINNSLYSNIFSLFWNEICFAKTYCIIEITVFNISFIEKLIWLFFNKLKIIIMFYWKIRNLFYKFLIWF